MGGPFGWLVADARPELVKAIIAVEPIGPPFTALPGFGRLDCGLTASPITYMPPAQDPQELRTRLRKAGTDGLQAGRAASTRSTSATSAWRWPWPTPPSG